MHRISLALSGLLTLASGCSGIGPGDYAIFRVASGTTTFDEACFPGGQDPDEVEDTTTFAAGQTFAVFAGGNGRYFLDFESVVIEGVKSGGAYTFSGEDVDVTYFGANDASRRVLTEALTVLLDVSGDAVGGTTTNSTTQSCSGGDCQDFDTFSCTGTGNFRGTRVRGVDLEHPLP